MSDTNKRRLGYAILILAIVLAGVLGVSYPIPAPPDNTLGGLLDPAPVVRGSGYFARFNQPVQFKQTLVVDGASTLTGAVGVTGAQTNASTLTVTGAAALNGGVSISGVSFSGPIKFAAASTVVSGTLIAHGLATTPTVVLLTPVSTGGYTTTVPYIMASNTTSFTVGVADNVTVTTLYWMAGK